MTEKKAKVEIVQSAVGISIYINDYRIAGSSPLGGGKVQHTFMCKETDLFRAIGVPNAQEDCAALGISPEGIGFVATPDGLNVDGHLITWAELEVAKLKARGCTLASNAELRGDGPASPARRPA